MRIDAHQHFWNYSAREYPWIPVHSPLPRDWLPADLAPLLAQARFDGCVAVQARQTLEESHWLLNLADHFPIIKGVVGWVDLRSPRLDEDLASLAKHPRFVGVRHVVQDEPDPEFMLQPSFLRGLSRLKPFKLRYDLLTFPQQLPAAIQVARALPEQPFVLDHLSKPSIKDAVLEPWEARIRELALCPNVHCKISGLVTEAKRGQWKPSDFVPYLDVIFDAFGEDRIMFGSDWPVCLLAESYEQVAGLIRDYTSTLPPAVRDKVFGANAAKFYGLK